MNLSIDEKTGKHKDFAFIKCPPHVQHELIKINGIKFKQKIHSSRRSHFEYVNSTAEKHNPTRIF